MNDVTIGCNVPHAPRIGPPGNANNTSGQKQMGNLPFSAFIIIDVDVLLSLLIIIILGKHE